MGSWNIILEDLHIPNSIHNYLSRSSLEQLDTLPVDEPSQLGLLYHLFQQDLPEKMIELIKSKDSVSPSTDGFRDLSLIRTNSFDTLSTDILKGRSESRDPGSFLQFLAQFNLAFFMRKHDMFPDALTQYGQLLEIGKERNFTFFVAYIENEIGAIHYGLKDLVLAFRSFSNSLDLFIEMENAPQQISVLNNIGLCSWHMDQFQDALEYFSKAIDLNEQIPDDYKTGAIYLNMGLIYWRTGNFSDALTHYQSALTKFEIVKSVSGIALCQRNMSIVYDLKGDYEEALNYSNKALVGYKQLNDQHGIASVLNNLASIYFKLTDYDKSLYYANESISIAKETSSLETLSLAYLKIMQLHIRNNNLTLAEEYHEKMIELSNEIHTPSIKRWIRLMKANLLLQSKRIANQAEAQKILREIADDEVFDIEHYTDAISSLADILLFEYGISDDPETLQEVLFYLDKLDLIADQQNSLLTKLHALSLKSRYHLLVGEPRVSQELLKTAINLAETHDLHRYSVFLNAQFDELLETLVNLEDNIDEYHPLIEEIGEPNFRKLLQDMVQGKSKEMGYADEVPILLIILSNAGTSMFSYHFSSDMQANEQIFGGFLSTIDTVINEAFSGTGSIERIKHGEYTLLVDFSNKMVTCYVIKGSSYLASKKLDRFVTELGNKPSELSQILLEFGRGELSNMNKVFLTGITEDIFLQS